MSSVLHPVGPEPRERYWVRRVAVLVAVIVAIGIVIALVGNAMSAGSAVQAEPAPPASLPPTVPVAPASTPTPGDTASPTPSDSPTPSGSPTPGATTPSASASPTDGVTPGPTVTPDPRQTPKTEKSTAPTDADKRKAAQQAAEKKAAAQKKAAANAVSCTGGDLRQTLMGPKKVEATKQATFSLSLINGSAKPCYLKVTGANFTLTVVSGKDRIWSSEDCPAVVPAGSRKLAAQKSLDWKVTWKGNRSAPGCKTRPEKPKAGYYWAIASFDGAREVRWRIVLT